MVCNLSGEFQKWQYLLASAPNRFPLRYGCSLPGMNWFNPDIPSPVSFSCGSNPSEPMEQLQMRRSPYVTFNSDLFVS